MLNRTTPTRAQLRRTKGWRMPENTVKGVPARAVQQSLARARGHGPAGRLSGRGAASGGDVVPRVNHSPASDDVTHEIGLGGHAAEHARIHAGLPSLRGKNLACWCSLDAPALPTCCWRWPMAKAATAAEMLQHADGVEAQADYQAARDGM
jgi:hypothetical protein